jgi:hypothetical protein
LTNRIRKKGGTIIKRIKIRKRRKGGIRRKKLEDIKQ